MSERPARLRDVPLPAAGPATAVFVVLAVLWLIPRVLLWPTTVPVTVRLAVSSVEVAPFSGTGRVDVRGLPGPGEDSTGLFERAEAQAARRRLEGRIRAANDRLVRLTENLAGRIELFPEEGVAGLRLSGLIVPFYDSDADHLSGVRRDGKERPRETLETVSRLLDVRLSEPENGFVLEESVRRRELTRLLRDVSEELQLADDEARSAVDELREELLATARRAEGPFRRRGPLRVAEIVLAALLAATLRRAVGRERPPVPPWLTVTFAPVAATGVVLLLEGTDLLPVDPLTGTSVLFVPLSFALGLVASIGLSAAARPALTVPVAEEALAKPHEESRPAPPPVAPQPSVEPPPRSEREIPDEGPARTPAPFFSRPQTPEPGPERLPFQRKRGRGRDGRSP